MNSGQKNSEVNWFRLSYRAAAAALLAAAAIGCAAETGLHDEVSEELKIEQFLQQKGFDVSDLVFDGDRVVVEGDILFDRDALLDDATDIVPKAYGNWGGWQVDRSHLSNVQLVFESDVPLTWQLFFMAAAQQWSQATAFGLHTAIDISPLNTGDEITVSMEALPQQFQGVPVRTAFPTRDGAGRFRTGPTIEINTNYSGTCADSLDDITPQLGALIVLHEIGHTLGFHHPHKTGDKSVENPDGVYLWFTQRWSASHHYNTVMQQGGVPSCENPYTQLQGDDRWAAVLYYPE